MAAPGLDDLPCAARFFFQSLARQAGPYPQVVAISGLPGAGKTTLARQGAAFFGARAVHVSEDDFLAVPTARRKSFLQKALDAGDLQALQALVRPDDPAENPYADPESWYDGPALRACLSSLKKGQRYEREGAWDQQTGLCNRRVVYQPPAGDGFILIDANFPLAYQACLDRLVYLSVTADSALQRQAARDSHRSEALYLAYKDMIDISYTRPYQILVRGHAQNILNLQLAAKRFTSV